MKLRDYQEESLAALWSWFRANPEGAPLLVIPTGGGKSLILAEIAKAVCRRGPDRRVLVLAHSVELLGQNAEELQKIWQEGDIGIYSAGLKERSTRNKVIIAGIGSVYERAEELGKFSLVIIDEVHRVPPDGEGCYRTLIEGLRKVNPGIRFVGLTATPFRLGSGMLTDDGGIFTEIAYEVGIKRLISEGYLSPLVTKKSKSSVNLEGVRVTAKDFNQADMERRFNQYDKVEQAVKEIITLGRTQGRKSWLVFASGVDHAKSILAALRKGDVISELITGETPPIERAITLKKYKAGELTALVNVDVLTTGFNHPGVDLLAVLRGTKSTSLWIQMCGRGSRKAEEKKDCLILDYGGNAEEHGPLDQITLHHRSNPLTGKTETSLQKPKVKACPACDSVVANASRECPDCGYEFVITEIKHAVVASSACIISEPDPPIEVEVKDIAYRRHEKEGKIPSLRVDYILGQVSGESIVKVSAWKCFEHDGRARHEAWCWWRDSLIELSPEMPSTVQEALERTNELKVPTRIVIQREGKFFRVLRVKGWRLPTREGLIGGYNI